MLKFQDLAALTVEVIQEEKVLEQRSNSIVAWKEESESEDVSDSELRRAKIKLQITDTVDNSSLHGLSYILDKKHSIRRLFWFLITLAAFAYSVEKVYESTVNYFRYPATTAITRQYVSKMDFPAVSFCNLNDMKFSKMNGTPVDESIKTNSIHQNITGEEYRNITKGAAHDLEDMVVQCVFDGQPCSHHNFTDFFWKQGDRCFTFNKGDSKKGVLSVTGAGVKRSLDLTINIQHYDYYRDGAKSGIHLILHDQLETPVSIQGPIIPVGFVNYVEINKKKLVNLPPPYKTRCGTKKLKYTEAYSMHLCWLESLTDFVVKECGCKDFFMPDADVAVCSLDEAMNCMWPAWAQHDKLKLYECPLPCSIDTFGYKMSRSLYPATAQADRLAALLPNLTAAFDPMDGEITLEQFLRDNLLRVVLYFDDLSYELVEQKPSYDTLVWLGDVGGQVGLFVGAGVLTYFEFLDCLLMVVYIYFFEKFPRAKKGDRAKRKFSSQSMIRHVQKKLGIIPKPSGET